MTDPQERQEEEARPEMAALNTMSWINGSGTTVWAQVIEDELARHEQARASLPAKGDAARRVHKRIHGTALVIVLAIGQVLAFEQRVCNMTRDGELHRARNEFDREVGVSAKDLRDVATHLDAYAVGKGDRQTGKGPHGRPITQDNVHPLIYWTDTGVSYLDLGGDTVNLHTAAKAAVALAKVVERVRERRHAAAQQRYLVAVRDRGP